MGKTGSFNLGFTASNEDIKTQNGANHNKDKERSNGTKNELVQDIEEEEGPARATWGNGLEFLMSCISLSVGLGNIWRFPFTAYENGGGAFLIPYIIVLFLIGKPIYYFEMLLGQFTSRGSIKAMSVIPVLKGVAIGQQIAVVCVLSYYTSLIALTLFYMVKSFYSTLPWSFCWENWTDVHCIPADPKLVAAENPHNLTSYSSSELYFIREVIKQKDQIDDGIGYPDLQLTMWLAVAWIVVFLVIIKGVKSSGKISYFLAIFPYAVLITLLVRAVTLEGSWEGIKFFIKPDFSTLLKPQIWKEAVTQNFFSMGTGMGAIIFYSSHNKFHHRLLRYGITPLLSYFLACLWDREQSDALIVTSMDTFTSLLGGFTIFGILGNLAFNLGEKDVGQVIKSGGSGIAFISYPEAIAKFDVVPQLFAVLFFFMLFTLGVGSAVGLQSAIVSNLMDVFPKAKQWMMAGICCIVGFLVGLIYVTPGGQWMLNLVDHYGGTFLIFALTILQLAGVIWVYGLEKFCWDVEFMLNWKVTRFWRFSWSIITPGLLIIIFIYNMARLENPTYMNKDFPTTAHIAGWVIFAVGLFQFVLWSAWAIVRDENKLATLKNLFTYSPQWGPKSTKTFTEWNNYKDEKLTSRRIISNSNQHSSKKKALWVLTGKYD